MRVKDILSREPYARESDAFLIATYWKGQFERSKLDLTELSGLQVLRVIAEGKLASSESIRRCRAKLQSEYVELRGANYNERAKRQVQFKEDIKNVK